MAAEITHEKQQVHELIDRLAPSQVAAVRGLIEAILGSAAGGPADVEPVIDEDRVRFHEGRARLAQRGGKGIPMEQVLAEFGLKPA